MNKLYETDFHDWCFTQAQILREKIFDSVDLENVIEELESMGRGERKELTSFLTVLFLHILKYMYQPSKRSKSWQQSIAFSRKNVKTIMKESPSLKHSIPECSVKAYEKARQEASQETGLDYDLFPEVMPFPLDKALEDGWMPS